MSKKLIPLTDEELSNWKSCLSVVNTNNFLPPHIDEDDELSSISYLSIHNDFNVWNLLNPKKKGNPLSRIYKDSKKVIGMRTCPFPPFDDEEPYYSSFLDMLEHEDAKLLRYSWCQWYNLSTNDFIEKLNKKFYFLTITGKDRIPDNEDMICKMEHFSNDIFNNDRYERFVKVIWNIEVGKHKDKPNLHLHAVIVFKESTKNFIRDCKSRFLKYFKIYGVDILMKPYTIAGSYYNDKVDYLRNKDKSILHQNYRDLDILMEL